MSNEFVKMPYREMIEAMMAGKRLEFEGGGSAHYDNEDFIDGPFVYENPLAGSRPFVAWNDNCRIKEEPKWRPEFGELVKALEKALNHTKRIPAGGPNNEIKSQWATLIAKYKEG